MHRYDRGPLPYTDLAVERRRADTDVRGVDYTCERIGCGSFERIIITTREAEESVGRPRGKYSTLNLLRMDLLDSKDATSASEEIAKEIIRMLSDKPKRILVAGLGNRELTADALGPKVADKVKPTRHIRERDNEFFSTLGCAEISVIAPGVMAKTGLESVNTVASVCRDSGCDAVIAIDAIATRSYERLGSTVQITDTGISPGSGLFNVGRTLSEKHLGIPVISVGVPTVIDARMIYLDALGEEKIPEIDKIPSPSMFVSPKEIDEIVNSASQIIANAINIGFGLG